MQTAYIYALENRHSKEEIDYIAGLIDGFYAAGFIKNYKEVYRFDLKAKEWKATVTDWTYDFLHYLRDGNRLEVFNNPL